MTNAPANSNAAAAKPETAAAAKPLVRKEIGARWGKFSEPDLSARMSGDDLVTKVVAKYGIDQTQAQRDVDALLKGRKI